MKVNYTDYLVILLFFVVGKISYDSFGGSGVAFFLGSIAVSYLYISQFVKRG